MYWEAEKKKKKMKRDLMKWSFIRRTEGKQSAWHTQFHLGKVSLKVSSLARRASTGTQTKIPQNALPLISAGFLWVLLYSIDTARDHGAKGPGQWLSRLRTRGKRWETTIVYYKINKHNWLTPPFTSTWPSLRTLLKWKHLYWALLELLVNAIWWGLTLKSIK